MEIPVGPYRVDIVTTGVSDYGSEGLYGIYGIFRIQGWREILCYIGKSAQLPVRLRGPYYHEEWLPGEFIRVLYFPYDPREGHQTLSQIEGSLDLIELHPIMKI